MALAVSGMQFIQIGAVLDHNISSKRLVSLCSVAWPQYTLDMSPNGHWEILLTVTSFMILKFSAGIGTDSLNGILRTVLLSLLCSQCPTAQVLLAKVATDTFTGGIGL